MFCAEGEEEGVVFYVEGEGVVHCTFTPASLCWPLMYPYCSMLRV